MSGKRKWKGQTHGTPWMHKALIILLKVLPLWVLYLVMALVIPFYLIFNRQGYLSIYHYLRRRRGWNPVKAFLGCYGNHFLFGTAVLDRFATYAGKRFKTDAPRLNLFSELEQQEEGFILLSSHIGNAEMCGYMLRSDRKRMNAISFGGEKESIRESRRKMLEANNIRLIPTDEDMNWLFTLNAALADGEIVNIHGDRSFGSLRTIAVQFLGAEARLPQGPFTLAAMRNLPVLAGFCLKTGLHTYRVDLYRLDTEDMHDMGREEMMNALSQNYARQMEEVLASHPLQWYNFFEFWEFDK